MAHAVLLVFVDAGSQPANLVLRVGHIKRATPACPAKAVSLVVEAVQLLLPVGVGPECMQIGDDVLVLRQCFVPHVAEAHHIPTPESPIHAPSTHQLGDLLYDSVHGYVAVRDNQHPLAGGDMAYGDFSHGVCLSSAGRSPDYGYRLVLYVRLCRLLSRCNVAYGTTRGESRTVPHERECDFVSGGNLAEPGVERLEKLPRCDLYVGDG